MLSRQVISLSFRRALSRATPPEVIRLQKEYPALFQLALPLNPKLSIDETVLRNQMLVWKCPNGVDHEWSMPVSDMIKRFQNGKVSSLCPFCTGGRVSETNCISGNFPLLEEEWDSKRNGRLTPDRVTYGSTHPYWWKCKCGSDHYFQASPNRRTDLNVQCPFCAEHRVSITNSLQGNYPELSSEWDREKNGDLSPNDLLYSSRKLVWWKCSKGHSWMDSVNRRTLHHTGCPVCGIPPHISIATRCPSLVDCWDYSLNLQSSPESTSVGSRKRAFWKCSSCSASFSAVVSRVFTQFVMNGECLCPKCAGRQ